MSRDKEEKGKWQAIQQAASKVFSEKGYHRATIDEIARRANIGKGTVYEYFASKEELFHEVIRSGVEYYMRSLRVHLVKKGTVYERLERLYKHHVQMIATQNEIKEILSNEFGKIPDQLKKWMGQKHEELIDQLQAVIEKGIESGEVRPVHPRIAAHMVLNGVKVLHWYAANPVETMESVMQEELRIIWAGLSPPT
jgi:TetR/AcrR family fatty acid metabolism transcriptional regulator